METLRICMSGPGAAGTAIAKLLLSAGARDIVMCDRSGILHTERPGISGIKAELARLTNPRGLKGSLAEAMRGADVFIGVSAGGLVTADMIAGMADKPIVFAMANPDPEITPDAAIAAGAYIAGSGRSDYMNQINNVLAFPGIFRGALDARVKRITEGMKVVAARALADMVPEDKLRPEFIIPDALDPTVAAHVAAAVKEAARRGE